MKRPVALLVCAYGRSPYLRRCLASLAPHLRDGASLTLATSPPNEETEAAARDFGARYLVNPRRVGIAADWNFALQNAGAPLVTLCHQDDEYAPDYVESMAGLFEIAPDVVFAACDHTELGEHGER